jgi:hypothetical protein
MPTRNNEGGKKRRSEKTESWIKRNKVVEKPD